jgi:hypothetical protein
MTNPHNDSPVPFGYQCQWLAVRSDATRAVADAVFLRNEKNCTWSDGIAAAYGSKLFVSPPVDGWTFVVGNCLPDCGRPDGPDWVPDRCTPWLVHLSRQFGEVQYFGSQRVVEYHAWAKACGGRIIRAYSYLGEQGCTIWNRGDLTAEEATLGFTPPPENLSEEEAVFAEVVPDEEAVMQIAGIWSINPQTLESYGSTSGLGSVGDLGPTFYKVDGRKITYAEYWNMAPGGPAIFAWLMKTLRIPFSTRSYATDPEALFAFDGDYVPDYARRLTAPYVQFAESLAPGVRIVETVPTIDAVEGYAFHYLNREGTIAILIPYTRCQYTYPPMEKSFIVFATPLEGEELLVTSNGRSGFAPRPGVQAETLRTSAEETYERHRARIEQNRNRIQSIAATDAEYRKFLQRLTRADFNHKQQRGLYIEMTQDEVNRIRGMT